MLRRSRRREPKPDPVPPPNEWKIRNPWRDEQLSICMLVKECLHVHDAIGGYKCDEGRIKDVQSIDMVRIKA